LLVRTDVDGTQIDEGAVEIEDRRLVSQRRIIATTTERIRRR
jgi:hypothetical protein